MTRLAFARMFTLAVAVTAAAAVPASAAFISYRVTVDTTALSGQTGSLELQFNPADPAALSATAAVTNFVIAGGSVDPAGTPTGDITGELPGAVTLGNSTAFNDLLQGASFGTGLSFDLTLSGPAVDTPDPNSPFGSTFAFSLLDASLAPLLTSDPSGALFTVDLNPDGTATVTTFPTDTGAPPVASVVPAAVPEPSTLALGAAGIGLLAGRRLRSRPRSLPTR